MNSSQREEALVSKTDSIILSRQRTSALRRLVSGALILALLPFAPAHAQQANDSQEEPATVGVTEFVGVTVADVGILDEEANLRQTLRHLTARAWHLGPVEIPGFDQAIESVGEPGASVAQGTTASAQDSPQKRRMPWWAWALIGAGIAIGVQEIEFGNETEENK